jgi:hypothetical protein
MKVAGIHSIIVKLFERPDLLAVFATPASVRLPGLRGFALVLLILCDMGKELGGLRIDPPLG